MSPIHCDREQEVLEALRSGGWRERSPGAAQDASRDSLWCHARTCPVCADAVLVAEALGQEGERARAEAALPRSGLIWWRAQMMASREAAERAAQPLAIAERVATASGLAALVAAAAIEWPRLSEAALRWTSSARFEGFMASLGRGLSSPFLIASLGACLALAGFVLYIVCAEE